MRRPLIASAPHIQIAKSLDQRVCLGQGNNTEYQSWPIFGARRQQSEMTECAD
jgi:hypothetical protein